MKRKEFITLSEIVGFWGVEKYDLILYLSHFLSAMNNKVLIIDNSETGALTYCIPVPSALNPKVNKITFRNIDFVKDSNPSDFKGYDYIMVDYGFRITQKELTGCAKLFVVTDKQQHNIDSINKLKVSSDEVYLILKDLTWKDKAESILKAVTIGVNEAFYLNYDEADRAYMIELQHDEKLFLKKLSPEYKSLIQKIITNIFQIHSKEYGLAYKILKRGA